MANRSKFELYKDRREEWRWRLRAGNGKIVAVGESYSSRTRARGGIFAVCKSIESMPKTGGGITLPIITIKESRKV